VTKTVDRRDVAEILDRIASFMELQGEQPFRVRAFRSSARAVDALPKSIQDAIEDGSLAESKGVGPATMHIVREVVTTGHSSLLEDLREQVPPGLVDMLSISGLGVAKIRLIHEQLGVDSLPDLEAAAREGRLATLPRFGQKTAENILKGIASLRRASEFRLLHHATEEAHHLTAALDQLPGVLRAQVVGDVRRRMELVQELVIVVVADVPPTEVFDRLADLPGIHEFAGTDERVVTLRFAGGSSAQIIVTTPVNAGAVLLEATGSRAHLDQLAEHARSNGFTLQGAALWRGSEFIATPDESTMYRALGLDSIPAELREPFSTWREFT
jgi:DNA polymerase (family 10)